MDLSFLDSICGLDVRKSEAESLNSDGGVVGVGLPFSSTAHKGFSEKESTLGLNESWPVQKHGGRIV